MFQVGILGATGYVGAELVRLLGQHPQCEIALLDSRSYGGVQYGEIYPSLGRKIQQQCITVDLQNPTALKGLDVLFCALPHGLSQQAVKVGLEGGLKVIDLSADFRIHDPKVYEQWYQTPHQEPELLKQAVYGLTEINREAVASAQLVANPGCYPTSILLPLIPLLKAGVIETIGIIADAKSGVSGAGRSLSDGNLFAQCNENLKAYGLGVHRHIPEIEQELSKAAGEAIQIQFTPHLVPMNRGILTTLYLTPKASLGEGEMMAIYQEAYGREGFVRCLPQGQLPQTKAVAGSNYCDIGFTIDRRTGRLLMVSAIDNLMKGAAGQGVQNMNVMLGLPEDLGINQLPLWP